VETYSEDLQVGPLSPRIIFFRPSMGRLVGAGYRFGRVSTQQHLRLPPDAAARAAQRHAKAVRLPGT